MNMKGFAGDYGLERYPLIEAVNLGAQVPCERVLRQAPIGEQVADVPAPHGQGVGHQPPVAAPPQGLGAHDRGPAPPSQLLQPRQARGELRAGHVVRVGPERLDLPAPVGAAGG